MTGIRDVADKTGSIRAGGSEDAQVSWPGLTGLRSVLTEREVEVSLLVAKGLTNEQIGHVLGVSRNAVKATLSRAFRRLEIESRVELVAVLFDRL
jgi:DNA-binding CsgD family transcriptional regulator